MGISESELKKLILGHPDYDSTHDGCVRHKAAESSYWLKDAEFLSMWLVWEILPEGPKEGYFALKKECGWK